MDFSLLFSLLFAFFHAVADASGGASAGSDIQLLISFKNSLPDPKPLDSWRPGGSPCYTFTGVSCLNGAVSSVVLDSAPLSTDYRAVATSLLPLPNLEKLSLSFANLSGSLGSSRCSGTLVELDLAGNSLSGSVADVADVSVSCAGLKLLNMSDNLIGQPPIGSFSAVATGVGAVVLESLDLSRNKIFGETNLQLLLSWPGIKHLDLRDNELSGNLPPITSCATLQFLDLSSNALFGEISNGVLGGCGNLSFLNISSNHFSGKLPRDLSYCTSLVSFSICNNNFSGELPVDAFSLMLNLKSLELCFNNLVGRLSDSLSKLSRLELLDLSSNNLSGSIPPWLCQPLSTSLTELYLQNNRFTGSIPDSLSNCSKLVSLDLSFNYLTGVIPAALGSLTQLHDLIMWQNMLGGEIPSELGRIKPLENLILENNDLTGVIPAGLCNCTSLNWLSLTSNNLNGPIPPWLGRLSNLAILKLGNNSFSGPIPPELGDCQSLIWLDLNSNRLNGSIPSTLAKQSGKIAVGLVIGKRYVYLRNIDGSSSECHGSGNLLEFAGIRQEELTRLPSHRVCNFSRVYMGNTQYTFNNNGSMIFLDLSYNELGGEIPKELGDMYYLMILNLGHNLLSGCIPTNLGNLRYVGVFDLSHNALQGQIPPSFSSLSLLSEIDFSNNNLNGTIPVQGTLQTFPRSRYENNPDLCGFPLNPCPDNGANWSDPNQKSHRRRASLAGSVTMGMLFSLFCIFGLVMIAVESKKRQRKNRDNISTRDIYIDSRSHSGTANTIWKLTGTKEALSIGLATFDKPLRKLTFADLLEATNGFRDCMIGSGGFGDVYRAHLKDGSIVAIKKLKHISGQGDREFTAEMETIGKIKHRNLVPLLGYCKVREERLLVYEYMKYGSLEDVLHDRKKAGIKLNWAARRKIALGAARGLAFLHHSCIPHIIHRDMKSSNVLIDENLEARVSDFGMARWMTSAMDTHLSVSTLAGTPGYVPPEYYQYYQSFHCTTKGDVYSYGVVLLELLTGKQPTNSSDFGDNNLVGWVKQHSKLRITDVFDNELLKEDPNLVLELLEHLKIAHACLEEKPLHRPTMLNVMAMFKEIQAGSSVDTISSVTASVDGSFGMVNMSLKEGKEEKQ